MKYVLIHWTATNETSVLTEECVRDKTMLKDFDKEGMVRFGKLGSKEPKGGWTAYLGRVKCVSERKCAVEEKEREFIGECHDALTETEAFLPTSSRRSQKRKLSASESEQSGDYGIPVKKAGSKKEIATAKKAAQDKAFASIIQRMGAESENEDDSESVYQDEMEEWESTKQELRIKIKELQKELAAERGMVIQLQRANLMLQKNLPDILKRTCKEAISTSSAVPIARPCSPSLVQKCNSGETQKHSFEIIRQQSPSVIQQCNSSVQPRKPQLARPHSPLFAQSPADQTESYDIDDNNAEEQQTPTISPGASLPPLSSFIDSVQMSEILHSKNERKMTLAMLSILFERKVLAASSVTGKSKEGRPALDREKVQLIISHVLERFPTASVSVIKATMAQKCKDARNATEARKTKAENV